MPVIDEIAAERRRQMEGEGWAPEHDDLLTKCELAYAAACYAMGRTLVQQVNLWPWHNWWKPKDRRHDLIRAAALIVAEIERLDRAALTAQEKPPSKTLGGWAPGSYTYKCRKCDQLAEGDKRGWHCEACSKLTAQEASSG